MTSQIRCTIAERIGNGLYTAVKAFIENTIEITEELCTCPTRKAAVIGKWEAVLIAWNEACSESRDGMVDIGVQPLSGGNKGDPD